MIGVGRYVFALSTIGFGICGVIWRDSAWQFGPAAKSVHTPLIGLFTGILEIVGGCALAFSRTERGGAFLLSVIYGITSLMWLPLWVRNPLVFDALGNFFELFSMVCGALILYGRRLQHFGYYGFAISVVSFAIYQAVHADYTAALVPKWIPPGQMFWVMLTTIAFALAAIALLVGRWALPAARLTTLMIVLFGLLIWLPATLAKPSLGHFVELFTNFAISGAAWVVADHLAAGALPNTKTG